MQLDGDRLYRVRMHQVWWPLHYIVASNSHECQASLPEEDQPTKEEATPTSEVEACQDCSAEPGQNEPNMTTTHSSAEPKRVWVSGIGKRVQFQEQVWSCRT